jgi:hypothetical protein
MRSYKTGEPESATLNDIDRQLNFAFALTEREAAALAADLERVRQSPCGVSVEGAKLLRALQGRLNPAANRECGRVRSRTESR